MARRSAINAVADGVKAALDVAALRAQALAPGGVYRGRPNAQRPPFVSIGPCSEVPYDAMGLNYGAIVTVPIHAITNGTDANGESRCASILDKVMELLDEPSTVTATGYTVRQKLWMGTTIGPDENLLVLTGDPSGSDGVATFEFTVWPT
jgi:hypothetical protein